MAGKTKIMILDILLNQMDKNDLPDGVLQEIDRSIDLLKEKGEEGKIELRKYLKGKNGKSFKGIEEKRIYKYRLSKGDRMLYSWGKNFPYIRDSERDALVLISYAQHADQVLVAKRTHYLERKHYIDAEKWLSEKEELGFSGMENENFDKDDIQALASIFHEDFINTNTMSIVDEDCLDSLSPENYDHYLSNKQADILEDLKKSSSYPMLILGGAGTGKTLIAQALLARNASNDKIKSAYFTQSYELLKKTENGFNKLTRNKSEKNVDFFNINDFCRKALGFKETEFVDTFLFINDFLEKDYEAKKILAKNKLDPLAIWTEIRGVIKGSMGKNWDRVSPIHQDQIPYKKANDLVKKGYLIRDEIDKKSLHLNMPINEIEAKKNYEVSEIRNALETIIEHFKRFDSSKRSLTKEEYMNLDDESSYFRKDDKMIIWDIYLCYEKYLINNKLYDDNDLARKATEILTDQYDLVVIDEVQDYTELQINLLVRICKYAESNKKSKRKRIVFLGDKNQNVNPTMFRDSRIRILFSDESGKMYLNQRYLNRNYRCSENVVDIANKMAEIRRETIGSNDAESEERLVSGRAGDKSFRLKYTEQNLRLIITEIVKRPNTVILVPDNYSKEFVINCYGRKEYMQNKYHKVFTIAEIKGMEYQYVLCFNMFGRYTNDWNTVLKDKSKSKHNSLFRYYFNIVNVAVTRSQQVLGFIDEECIDVIESTLMLENLERFDLKTTHLSSIEINNPLFIKEAEKLEEEGQYEAAADTFEKAGASFKEIFRCRAKQARHEKRLTDAVKYAVIAQEIELASEMSDSLENTDLRYLVDFLFDANNYNEKKGLFSRIIDKYFGDFEENQINELSKFVLSNLDEVLVGKLVDISDEE